MEEVKASKIRGLWIVENEQLQTRRFQPVITETHCENGYLTPSNVTSKLTTLPHHRLTT